MKQDPRQEADTDNERRAMQVVAGLLLGIAVVFLAIIVIARA